METNISEVVTQVDQQNKVEKSETSPTMTLKVRERERARERERTREGERTRVSERVQHHMLWGHSLCLGIIFLFLTSLQSTVSSAPNRAFSAVKNIQSSSALKLPAGKLKSLNIKLP